MDILESAGQALQRWLSDPDNPAPLSSLQRDLHTLKGGARMAEVEPVGDLAQNWKAFMKAWWTAATATARRWRSCCNKSHDHLAQMLEQLQAPSSPGRSALELIEAIRAFRQGHVKHCRRSASWPPTRLGPP